MKTESESARKCSKIFLFGFLFLLTACADTQLPTWMTGEPGPEVLAAPRAVTVPNRSGERSWPNLADVPTKKPVFSDLKERQAESRDLLSDRMQAGAEMERIRNIPMPDPFGEGEGTNEDVALTYSDSSENAVPQPASTRQETTPVQEHYLIPPPGVRAVQTPASVASQAPESSDEIIIEPEAAPLAPPSGARPFSALLP